MNICLCKSENHIDHRSYARQGKFEIPTIHEGADARKIEEKFQNGQTSSGFMESRGKSDHKTTKCTLLEKILNSFWESIRCINTMEGAIK